MKSQPLDLVNLKIPAKPDYVAIARLTVSGIANRMGFSYDEIEDVKLAVSEACTNVVDHAYTGEDGEIEVCLTIYPDRLEVEVVDHGNSFDVSKVESRTGPISLTHSTYAVRERGLGIFLMRSLMDDVNIKGDNGVIVHMIKYIHENGVEEHAKPASYPT